MVSETCSPVNRVRGGRDGVTGGSSSKGTTVGVRVSRCDLFVAARVRRHRILIGAAAWRDVGSTHVRVRDSPHDPTSQIVAQLSENSPLVTVKNKRVGVSSARLNPATRGEARRAAEEECARVSSLLKLQ